MEIIQKYFKRLSEKQIHDFSKLDELYRYWNAQINVISRKDMDELYERHILHSLSIAKFLDLSNVQRVVDIGTGGGFPGIPLAIMFPNTQFVLIDSIGKKIKVVQEVATELKLKNVTAIHGRVEEWKGSKFDLAVTRAVAPLDKLGKWATKVLVSKNLGLVCLKGGDLKDEINNSGLKTDIFPISDFFQEDFFESKVITWSTI